MTLIMQGAANAPVYGLTTSDICTRTDLLKDGFRSWPSGHSSSSFAGLGFLSFYLAGKMRLWDQRGQSIKSWIAVTPLVGAAGIALSRTMDYRSVVRWLCLAHEAGIILQTCFRARSSASSSGCGRTCSTIRRSGQRTVRRRSRPLADQQATCRTSRASRRRPTTSSASVYPRDRAATRRRRPSCLSSMAASRNNRRSTTTITSRRRPGRRRTRDGPRRSPRGPRSLPLRTLLYSAPCTILTTPHSRRRWLWRLKRSSGRCVRRSSLARISMRVFLAVLAVGLFAALCVGTSTRRLADRPASRHSRARTCACWQ